MLGWIDDVEFSSRLARHGAAWLVPSSRVLHDDGMPAEDFGAGFRDRLRRLRSEPTMPAMWKNAYGLRNVIRWGREASLVKRRHAVAYWLLLTLRAAVFAPDHRWLRVRIYSTLALDGWRGVFRNASPGDWPSIVDAHGGVREFLDEHALSYAAPASAQIVAEHDSLVASRS
jgi:hypothetical protein